MTFLLISGGIFLAIVVAAILGAIDHWAFEKAIKEYKTESNGK